MTEQRRQRKRERESNEQPPRRLRDQRGHFQELQPQRIELGPAQLRRQWCHLGAEGMEQHLGRGVFEQTKEVGGKCRAGEAVSLQGIFEVFYEILTLPALTIGVIEQHRGKL